MQRKNLFPLKLFFFTLIASSASAQEPLPYSVRTRPYSGFSTGAIGDIRTVGMGGAASGLGDTFIAGAKDPAGLAMTLGIADTNYTSDHIHNGHVQTYDNETPKMTAFGAAAASYPWAFSMGFVPIGSEGQEYTVPNLGVANLLVETHEFRVSASRVLMNNRLSLGVSLNIGIGEEEVQTANFDDDHHASTLGATLGAMVQASDRILLSLAYTTPMHYAVSAPDPGLPGFFQAIQVPGHADAGLGWIPNRFFRGDFQLSFIGKTSGVALLSDDSNLVGGSFTLQPKLGAAYVFMDFKRYTGTVYGGTYFETSRIADTSDRMHGTLGLEAKFWILTFGAGVDRSAQYRNSLFAVGLDIGRMLEYLNVIPTPYYPPSEGFLPSPFRQDDDGLPRPLVRDWYQKGPKINPVEVVKKLPERVENIPQEAKKVTAEFEKEMKLKKPKKKKRKKTQSPAAAP